MDDDDDHIGPFNGRSNRGPDIAAAGCLWIVALFFACVAIFGGYGFLTDMQVSMDVIVTITAICVLLIAWAVCGWLVYS